VERFLSFIAMDVMQCDWDGYAQTIFYLPSCRASIANIEL